MGGKGSEGVRTEGNPIGRTPFCSVVLAEFEPKPLARFPPSQSFPHPSTHPTSMYYYLSFLRPPPKAVSLAQGGITITPQIANDLRTE